VKGLDYPCDIAIKKAGLKYTPHYGIYEEKPVLNIIFYVPEKWLREEKICVKDHDKDCIKDYIKDYTRTLYKPATIHMEQEIMTLFENEINLLYYIGFIEYLPDSLAPVDAKDVALLSEDISTVSKNKVYNIIHCNYCGIGSDRTEIRPHMNLIYSCSRLCRDLAFGYSTK